MSKRSELDLTGIATELLPFAETTESREILATLSSDSRNGGRSGSKAMHTLESEIHTNEFRDPILIVLYAAILAIRGELDLAFGNLRIAGSELSETQALKGLQVTALIRHVVSETNRQENSKGYETYTDDRRRTVMEKEWQRSRTGRRRRNK
ncbi:MAG: hypothetical protein H6822_25820 [Planctomycetaceae bacterium]|nr:hypothetical protein [Planctomycetaceae bacterium]